MIVNYLFLIFLSINCNNLELKNQPYNNSQVTRKIEYYINAADVHFRENPDIKGKVIRKFKKYEKVHPIKMSQNSYWVYLKTETGELGWGYASYIRAKFFTNHKAYFFYYPEKIGNNHFTIELIGGAINGNFTNPDLKLLNDLKKDLKNLNYYLYSTESKSSESVKDIKYLNLTNGDNCEGGPSLRGSFYPIFKINFNSKTNTINDKVLISNLINDNQTLKVSKLNFDSPHIENISSSFDNKPKDFSCQNSKYYCFFHSIIFNDKHYIYFTVRKKEFDEDSYRDTFSKYGLVLFDKNAYRFISIKSFKITHEEEFFITATDFNNDGVLEVWTETNGYEWHHVNVNTLDDEIYLHHLFPKC